jgi:hypothetical protein
MHERNMVLCEFLNCYNMKALDFIYYIMFQAYVRGNKTESGAFLINALWFSLFQFLLIFIIFAIVEINVGALFIGHLVNIHLFFLIIFLLLLLNLLYIYTPGRRNRILTRFSFSTKSEKAFFYSTTILFFVFLWIGVYLAGILLD